MGLLKSVFASVSYRIHSGHARSIRAKRNIITSFLVKGASIAINLLLVPLTINYVNPSRYGVWLTLSSIITWFSFFDIGFGNGLRNKFAEALARGDYSLARIYVSTTYAILTIIIGIVLILFIFVNFFVNWATILNTPESMAGELTVVAEVVFVFFCIRFVLQLINTILSANQEPATASYFDFLANALSLLIIFVLTKTTSGSLIYLALTLSLTPLLVLIIASFWLYRHEYKIFAPSIKFVRFSYARDLMNLGVKFFIIQIAALVLFNTNNIIVTQLFGPKEVTTFDVTFKLFSVITMAFNIIAIPMWSAFTEAYAKQDFQWIESALLKMKKIWILLSIITGFLLLFSNVIFRVWLGNAVDIPVALSIAMSVYVVVNMWQTTHVFFLNGIGKVTLQLYLVIFSGLINVPLAIFFCKKFGLIGITLVSAVLFLFMGTVFAIQTRKILNNSASKIWSH